MRVWRLLNTTDDSDSFVFPPSQSTLNFVPVVEAKTIHQFDHRFASFEHSSKGLEIRDFDRSEKYDPTKTVRARNYISDKMLRERLPEQLRDRGWFLTSRNIARATDERTMISAIIPRGASCEVTPYVETKLGAQGGAFLVAAFNSFAFDFSARQKVGGTHISYFILFQLPICHASNLFAPCPWGEDLPSTNHNLPSFRDWLVSRVLELSYTSWDLEAFASDCGWPGPPFQWNEDRRFQLRCELDAAFFHLYLGSEAQWRQQPQALIRAFITPRHAVSYIMDTFPIVKRKDEAKHGSYRTKDTILQIYDALAESIQTGDAYQDRLFPSPADILATHDPRWPEGVRPTLDPLLYFQCVLPLMMRFQPKGIERGRLLHALEILTDANSRSTATLRNDFSKKWAAGYPCNFGFSDATGVLIALLQDGNLNGVHQVRMDPGALIPVEDPWLSLDAFMAVRLAMEAPMEVVDVTEIRRKEVVATITRIAV